MIKFICHGDYATFSLTIATELREDGKINYPATLKRARIMAGGCNVLFA